MQTTALQQILSGPVAGDPVLRLAGAESCDDLWHRAHSALFSLELWRLSLPHAAAFVDGRAVFSELFQRQSRSAAKSADSRHTCETSRLQHGALQRSLRGNSACCPCGDPAGARVLWQAVSLGRVAHAALSRCDHAAAAVGFCAGKRLGIGAFSLLAALFVDALSSGVARAARAG